MKKAYFFHLPAALCCHDVPWDVVYVAPVHEEVPVGGVAQRGEHPEVREKGGKIK